jgi:hypothetical protein
MVECVGFLTITGHFSFDLETSTDPGLQHNDDVTSPIRSDGRRNLELSLMMRVLTIRTGDVLAVSN